MLFKYVRYTGKNRYLWRLHVFIHCTSSKAFSLFYPHTHTHTLCSGYAQAIKSVANFYMSNMYLYMAERRKSCCYAAAAAVLLLHCGGTVCVRVCARFAVVWICVLLLLLHGSLCLSRDVCWLLLFVVVNAAVVG